MSEKALRAVLGRLAQANFCFTLAEGLAESEVLARFGAVLAPDEDGLLAEEPLIGVTGTGRWAVALELGSSHGADPAVLCAVSRGTLAVSVRHALDSHVKLSVAEDGVVSTSLNTIPPMTRTGTEPDRLLPVLRELGLAGQPAAGPAGSDLWAVMEAVHRAFDVSFSARLWQGPFTIGEFPL
jgi:Family of unknown function (DUF6461)